MAGSEAQDAFCDAARRMMRPHNVDLPTGGFFAFAVYEGRMVTAHATVAIRRLARAQAAAAWRERPVQGHLARMAQHIYTPALDIRAFTQCRLEQRWATLALPGDTSKYVDLSGNLYRIARAIGGGWTERLHVDQEARKSASRWAATAQVPSPRICPLCRTGQGTPRHVIMQCPAVAVHADEMRDAVEAEMLRHASAEDLTAAAQD